MFSIRFSADFGEVYLEWLDINHRILECLDDIRDPFFIDEAEKHEGDVKIPVSGRDDRKMFEMGNLGRKPFLQPQRERDSDEKTARTQHMGQTSILNLSRPDKSLCQKFSPKIRLGNGHSPVQYKGHEQHRTYMPKPVPIYRIDIVPLTLLYGRRDPRFSYASHEPVEPGSLVSISFGKRMLVGVSLDCAPLSGQVPEWMKFVGPVILPRFLKSEQITLAWELSNRLYAPLGSILKLFFPILRKPRTVKIGGTLGEDPGKRRLTTRTKRGKYVFHPNTWEAAPSDALVFDRLVALGKSALKEKRLLVILVPEILSAELYRAKLRDTFPKANIRILTSRETEKSQYETYQAIGDALVDILVGTRQAIFAPFRNLSAIVIIDSEKQLSYTQWEMMPRYDAVEIAETVAQRERIPLFRLSVAPGISAFLPEAKIVGTPFAFGPKQPLVTIDLRQNYRRGSMNQPLSPKLIDLVRNARKAKQGTLILVKQRGIARFSLCAKCQVPVRCPNCQAALAESKEGSFRCLSCGYRSSLFPRCKECGHMHFKSFGAGTERIVRDLERAGFGEDIVRIDRDAQARKAETESLFKALREAAPGAIIVATYEAAYSLPLPPLAVIAMIEPDQGLFYPDFQSEERLWRELRRFGAKLRTGGQLIVQTFQPEAKFWTTWAEQPLPLTATPLLEERQILHYPPYYDLIQLECHPKKEVFSSAVAEAAEAALKRLHLPGVEVLPKYLPFGRKNRYHVLIRIARTQPFPDALHACLQELDPAIHITRNPISLHGS